MNLFILIDFLLAMNYIFLLFCTTDHFDGMMDNVNFMLPGAEFCYFPLHIVVHCCGMKFSILQITLVLQGLCLGFHRGPE